MVRLSGRRGRHCFLLAVVWACLLLALGASPAHADTLWALSSNSGSGSWFNTNNWLPNLVPNSSTNAVINNGGTALIASGSASTSNLTIGQTAAFATNTLSITGGLLTVNSNLILGDQANAFGQTTISGGSLVSSGMVVGRFGNGLLNITNGGHVNADATLGSQTNSSGIVNVSGTGSSWTMAHSLLVGYYGGGTLNITNGGCVSLYGTFSAVFNGTVNVSGAGSTWIMGDTNTSLNIGVIGTGIINITGGGSVTNNGRYVFLGEGPSGILNVSGTDSTWSMVNPDAQLFVGYSGPGIFNITNGGSVISNAPTYVGFSDVGTVNVSGAGSSLVLSAPAWSGEALTIGSDTPGQLNITNGGSVTVTGIAYVGRRSTGTVNVSGPGAKWVLNPGDQQNGLFGQGTLNITDGGSVINHTFSTTIAAINVSGTGSTLFLTDAYGTLGGNLLNITDGGSVTYNDRSATGVAINVSGTGSTLILANTNCTLSGNLPYGIRGTLTVANGGGVTAGNLTISNSQSVVRLHVSGNNMLVLGNAATNGNITNNGSVNLYADAFLPAGVYTPISAYPGQTMTWSGAGAYNAFGGTWDTTAHTLTVTAPTAATAGDTDPVTTGERLLFTDPASGKHVGASFGAVTNGTMFEATPMTGGELAALAATPGYTGSVLAGWDFVATNFAVGSGGGGPVLLSFDGGAGQPWGPMEASDLAVWHLQGGTWTPFAADFTTYDPAGVVSFPVSSFSGYAVTSVNVVPEPASLILLGLGGVVILRRRGNRTLAETAGIHPRLSD